MRYIITLLLSLILLVACGASDEETPESEAPPVVDASPLPIIQENPTENLAATVNGDEITISEVERYVAFFEAGMGGTAADRDVLISTVLEDRIQQKIIEQEAGRLGITVTDTDVQTEIDELEAIAAQQGLSLVEFFEQQGISADDYPQRILETILTALVNDAVTGNVATSSIQVRARHILVSDLVTAQQILDRLNAGEDFVALAAEFSLDPSTRDAGGDLGWIAPGDLLQPSVEAIIFALPASSRAPEPIQSLLGYHIVESIERAEDRPLAPSRIAEQRQIAWENWLADRRAESIIIRYIGPNAEG